LAHKVKTLIDERGVVQELTPNDELGAFNVNVPAVFKHGIEGSATFITQSDWCVDSESGDDGNVGTTASPIKTLSELSRRWSGKVVASANVSPTICLLGTFPSSSLALNSTITRGQSLLISGSLTTVTVGTITTFTARAAASNTSATILADISFASYVKKRIRLTSGVNANAIAWVLADLGGNSCRVSCFVSNTNASAVLPSDGDTFVIESFPTLVGGCQLDLGGGGRCLVRDLEFEAQTSFNQQAFYMLPTLSSFQGSGTTWDGTSGFFGCLFAGAHNTPFTFGCGFTACAFDPTTVFSLQGGRFSLAACAIYRSLSCGSSYVALQNSYNCFEGGTMTLTQTNTAFLIDVQVFGATGSRWALVSDRSDITYSAAIYVYGGSNTCTVAFEIRPGCSLQYITNKPGITGNNPGVNDIKLGGTDYGWAAIPTVNTLNNAMAVVRQ